MHCKSAETPKRRKIMYTNNLFTLNNISTISSDIVSTLPINKIPTLGEEGGNCAVCAGASKAVYAVRAADMVYVNVVQFGKVLLNAPMCGFGSVEALLAGVRRRLGEVCGVVTVNVRNCTCGWALKRTVRLGRPMHTMLAGA